MKIINQDHIRRIRQGDMSPLKNIFDANYQYCVQNIVKLFNCCTADAEDMSMEAHFYIDYSLFFHLRSLTMQDLIS